jgi:hypothetical protein
MKGVGHHMKGSGYGGFKQMCNGTSMRNRGLGIGMTLGFSPLRLLLLQG